MQVADRRPDTVQSVGKIFDRQNAVFESERGRFGAVQKLVEHHAIGIYDLVDRRRDMLGSNGAVSRQLVRLQ